MYASKAIRTVSMNNRGSANLPTQVRFFPTGISGGVMLWALPSPACLLSDSDPS